MLSKCRFAGIGHVFLCEQGVDFPEEIGKGADCEKWLRNAVLMFPRMFRQRKLNDFYVGTKIFQMCNESRTFL